MVPVAQLLTPHPQPLSKMERGAIPNDLSAFSPPLLVRRGGRGVRRITSATGTMAGRISEIKIMKRKTIKMAKKLNIYSGYLQYDLEYSGFRSECVISPHILPVS